TWDTWPHRRDAGREKPDRPQAEEHVRSRPSLRHVAHPRRNQAVTEDEGRDGDAGLDGGSEDDGQEDTEPSAPEPKAGEEQGRGNDGDDDKGGGDDPRRGTPHDFQEVHPRSFAADDTSTRGAVLAPPRWVVRTITAVAAVIHEVYTSRP